MNYKLILKYPYPFLPFDNYENLALAQHHGIPTRLLDWTRDPMVAAYFSVANTDKQSNGQVCVWALNTKDLKPDFGYGNIKFTTLLQHGLEFLHIQKGLFTEMLGADAYCLKKGQWPSLDTYLNVSFGDYNDQPYEISTYLKKLILSTEEATDVLKRLNNMGISKYRLMPTYDNVAASIKKFPTIYIKHDLF